MVLLFAVENDVLSNTIPSSEQLVNVQCWIVLVFDHMLIPIGVFLKEQCEMVVSSEITLIPVV